MSAVRILEAYRLGLSHGAPEAEVVAFIARRLRFPESKVRALIASAERDEALA